MVLRDEQDGDGPDVGRLPTNELMTTDVSRRRLLKVAFGAGAMTVAGGLLAACGGDDDDDGGDETATESEGAATEEVTEEATEEATEAETETEAATEAATEEETEQATEASTESDATEAAEASPTESETTGEAQTFEGGDRLMGKEIEAAASEGGTVIQGNHLAIGTLNPVLLAEDASGDLSQMMFEGMFETNPETLEPVGNLAESWSIAEDGETRTINLREGVMWHDGTAFTAEDVKFTYDLIMTEETVSPDYSEYTAKIASIEVIDDLTIEFVTNGVIPDFELEIGATFLAAKHVWENVDPADMATDPGSTGEDPSRVVGTGPFMFKEWLVEDHATLVKNPDYWDGAPHIDEFIHRYMGSTDAVIQALKVGDIDFARLSPSSVEELEAAGVTVVSIPTLSFALYGTNMDPERTTVFQDVEVRQALLFAADREAMVEAVRYGYGEVAVGTIPPLSWAANPDGIELTYPYDPDKAIELLDSAGWVPGDDGVREKDGERLSFEMFGTGGDEVTEGYLVALQEYWRIIGVEMTPRLEPAQALVERITQTLDFDTFLVRFGWSPSPDQSIMWACDANFNMVKYCNPDVDAILEEALHTVDRDRRIELYTEFQNLLLADLPMVVFDFLDELVGVSSRLHNFFPSTLNDRFNPETWWID